MQNGIILKIPRKKIVGRPRRTIHIDRKTESLCQKHDAQYLVGPGVGGVIYYVLFKPGETVYTKCFCIV